MSKVKVSPQLLKNIGELIKVTAEAQEGLGNVSTMDTDHEDDKKEREEHLEECKIQVRNARKKADEVDRAYEAAVAGKAR